MKLNIISLETAMADGLPDRQPFEVISVERQQRIADGIMNIIIPEVDSSQSETLFYSGA